MSLPFLPKVSVVDIDPAIWGKNAHNTLFRIEIVRNVGPNQSWLGILGQELYEVQYKWKTLCLGKITASWSRKMESRSHAIEAYIAATYDNFDHERYIAREAGTLSTYSYFYGSTFDYRLESIRDQDYFAMTWVQKNINTLLKHRANLLAQ